MDFDKLRGPVVAVFFLLALAIGVWIFRDYGISWDEKRNHINGAVSYKYICLKLGLNADEPVPYLPDYIDRSYGVFFELPLYAIEKALKPDDLREIYLMRHLCTFLAFWAGLVFFYLIILKRFGDWRAGLTGCLFLILSPRIFADSFYNSKDLVLMSLFIVSMYTMLRFLGERSYVNALLHSISSAAVIDTRTAGIVIPAVTIFFYIAGAIAEIYVSAGSAKDDENNPGISKFSKNTIGGSSSGEKSLTVLSTFSRLLSMRLPRKLSSTGILSRAIFTGTLKGINLLPTK